MPAVRADLEDLIPTKRGNMFTQMFSNSNSRKPTPKRAPASPSPFLGSPQINSPAFPVANAMPSAANSSYKSSSVRHKSHASTLPSNISSKKRSHAAFSRAGAIGGVVSSLVYFAAAYRVPLLVSAMVATLVIPIAVKSGETSLSHGGNHGRSGESYYHGGQFIERIHDYFSSQFSFLFCFFLTRRIWWSTGTWLQAKHYYCFS
jgi:hypothetical protein